MVQSIAVSFGHKFPIYAVHGWSGHGVAQTVRIGKAIANDFVGQSNDFENVI